MKSKRHIKKHTNNISIQTRSSTFANHTSRHADQSSQKSLPFTHADKIELKKYPPLLKIKNIHTLNPTRTDKKANRQ